MPVDCTCLTCGTHFTESPSRIASGRGRYCSRACANAGCHPSGAQNARWNGGPVPCTCLNCGKVFTKCRAAIADGEGRYCSRTCANARCHPFGASSGRWKGGRSIDQRGYVRFNRADGHHLLEHRVIMEQHIGRPVRDDEHVHHINGVKTDNRIENLQLMSVTAHVRLPKLNGRWSLRFDQCTVCGTTERRHLSKGMCALCYQRCQREKRLQSR